MGYGQNEHVVIRTDYPEISAKITETVSVVGGDLQSLWHPPMQPSSTEIVANANNLPAFRALWDGLQSEFPGYISKELLGLDHTGVHNIYKYLFTPINYEKTIIITANVHGDENVGQKILYRLLYHVCHDSNKYSHLSYLRNKVRMVVIPIVNPAGLVAGTRYNGNSVDINRNFTYGWNDYVDTLGTTNKGPSALSEAESRYIDAVLSQYANDGAVAHIDLHNTPAATPAANSLVVYAPVPRLSITSRNFVTEIAEAMLPDGWTIEKNFAETIEPTGSNQAANIYKLHATTAEWRPGGMYGEAAYSGQDMRTGLMFIGNIIIRASTMNKAQSTSIREPSGYELTNNVSTFVSSAVNAWEQVPQMSFTFKPKVAGLLYVSGELVFVNNTLASINYFAPIIMQTGNGLLTDSLIPNQQNDFEVFIEPNGKRGSISVNRVVPIHAPDYNFGDVIIRLMWKCDSGQILHRRSRMHVLFLPSDIGAKYEQHRVNGSNVMAKYYPAEVQ